MGFYSNLIDWIRSKNIFNSLNRPRDYVFGSIVSGTYTNWKHDQNPTILCLGNYMKSNGRWYVHGIQLHALPPDDLRFLFNLINNLKQANTITAPRIFYYYLKGMKYTVVKNGYRIYHTEFTNFKTIHPGFSGIPAHMCIKPFDPRDSYLIQQQIPQQVDETKLREQITKAINTKEI